LSVAELPLGKWRLSQAAAIRLVRDAVRDLAFSMQLMNSPPVVQRPNLRGKATIPRYLFEWQETKPSFRPGLRFISNRVTAEVDAEHGSVMSLSIYIWEDGDEQ